MMKHVYPTIAMTGGGSGGHITPLLSLARELKRQQPNCQIVYIGHKGDQFDSLHASGHYFDFMAFINAGKFRRYHGEGILAHLLDIKTLTLNTRDFFRVFKSTSDAWRILGHTKPDVLFVKGGFVSVPVGIAARLRRIPIITHDSDTIGGLANRIVGRWAKLRTTGMPADLYKFKAKFVGIPLDEHIDRVTAAQMQGYRTELKLKPKAKVVLLTGGANGSQHLNDLLVEAAPDLLNSHPDLYLIHVTGLQHESSTKAKYKNKLTPGQLARIQVLGLTNELYKYSGAADLIVTRAGATAMAEYALQAKACIVIPSPFLAGGHQLKNADMLAEANAAVILPETASADGLRTTITDLLADDKRRHQIATNLHKLAKPEASRQLAEIILRMAGKA